MENRSNARLADWLDRLSQESWQLELILSGFAIFLLASAYEPLAELGYRIEGLDVSLTVKIQLMMPFATLMAALLILLINLCIHVVFRGLWISAVGLRSVSEDIDFDVLQLQPRFDRFLRGRIGSFDRYIDKLEKICSILFAFTFLVLFMLLALLGVIVLASLINLALREWLDLGNHPLVPIVNILLFISSLLYFIDFLTLARLKRVRWLTPVYYPIYRFFSVITFAPLYRPLYYNLIDNRFGRRVGFLLVPYILFLMITSSVSYVPGGYFPEFKNDEKLEVQYYDDIRAEDAEASQQASIPSRYIDESFLEVFIPYNPDDDDEVIEAVCPGLETVRNPGLALEGVITINTMNRQADTDSLLQCMSAIHRIYINDSLHLNPSFHFYTHPQREDNGLLTVLDVAYLPRGEHLLRIETAGLESDTLRWKETARIPFWNSSF